MDLINMKSLAIDGIELKQLLINGVQVWKKTALPEGYQQLEYIETDGNQYIDTGVMASDYSNGIAYEFKGNITSVTGTDSDYLFGASADGIRAGNLQISATTTKMFYLILGANGDSVSGITAPTFGTDFTLITDYITSASSTIPSVTLNGNTFNETATTCETGAMPNANIWLLACNGIYGETRRFHGKLYSFIMTSADGTAIRNFVPCYRIADGVVGLYDTVEGVFYENLGTGAFKKPGYTNLILTSTTELGGTEIYNGIGWANGKRWSDSAGGLSENTDMAVTGWMPVVSYNSTLRMKNINIMDASSTAYIVYAYADGSTRSIGLKNYFTEQTEVMTLENFFTDESVIYFRISFGKTIGIPIVTINEEITEYSHNLVPSAIDADGNIFNGVGYKNNTYYSTSIGGFADSNSLCSTGYLPVANEFYVANALWGNTSGGARLILVNENFKLIGAYADNATYSDLEVTEISYGLYKFKYTGTVNTGYMAICVKGTGENLIVSLENPLLE